MCFLLWWLIIPGGGILKRALCGIYISILASQSGSVVPCFECLTFGGTIVGLGGRGNKGVVPRVFCEGFSVGDPRGACAFVVSFKNGREIVKMNQRVLSCVVIVFLAGYSARTYAQSASHTGVNLGVDRLVHVA